MGQALNPVLYCTIKVCVKSLLQYFGLWCRAVVYFYGTADTKEYCTVHKLNTR